MNKLMQENADVENIHECVAEYKRLLGEFKSCHESVQRLLPEDVGENETLDWYEPKMKHFTKFSSKVEKLTNSQSDCGCLVNASDRLFQGVAQNHHPCHQRE